MPVDYKKYPKNWKTAIRPAILERAKNKCEQCNVPNYAIIDRGDYNGTEAYQDMDGNIFNAKTGEIIGEDYIGALTKPKLIRVILTIAHLDHDITNNDYSNLKALCQKCHLNYDKENHKKNSRETRNKKRGLIEINFDI